MKHSRMWIGVVKAVGGGALVVCAAALGAGVAGADTPDGGAETSVSASGTGAEFSSAGAPSDTGHPSIPMDSDSNSADTEADSGNLVSGDDSSPEEGGESRSVVSGGPESVDALPEPASSGIPEDPEPVGADKRPVRWTPWDEQAATGTDSDIPAPEIPEAGTSSGPVDQELHGTGAPPITSVAPVAPVVRAPTVEHTGQLRVRGLPLVSGRAGRADAAPMISAEESQPLPAGEPLPLPPVGSAEFASAYLAYVRQRDPEGIFFPFITAEQVTAPATYLYYDETGQLVESPNFPPYASGVLEGLAGYDSEHLVYANAYDTPVAVLVTASTTSEVETVWIEVLQPGESILIQKTSGGFTQVSVSAPRSGSTMYNLGTGAIWFDADGEVTGSVRSIPTAITIAGPTAGDMFGGLNPGAGTGSPIRTYPSRSSTVTQYNAFLSSTAYRTFVDWASIAVGILGGTDLGRANLFLTSIGLTMDAVDGKPIKVIAGLVGEAASRFSESMAKRGSGVGYLAGVTVVTYAYVFEQASAIDSKYVPETIDYAKKNPGVVFQELGKATVQVAAKVSSIALSPLRSIFRW